MLADSSYLVTIRGQVGRVNRNGHFWAFTPGTEIIFDGKIFIPPMGTAQRRVPNALGPYKLDMGGGYLIHGTHIYNEDSIGEAVSHGCVRMHNDDLERLYHLVEEGVPVFIY
jgi:lipoprotein-anchoring transpeptidase ErfK/SrfK